MPTQASPPCYYDYNRHGSNGDCGHLFVQVRSVSWGRSVVDTLYSPPPLCYPKGASSVPSLPAGQWQQHHHHQDQTEVPEHRETDAGEGKVTERTHRMHLNLNQNHTVWCTNNTLLLLC